MFVEGGLPVEISVVRMLNELVRAPLADLDAAVTDVIGRLSGVCGASWACIFRLDAGTMVKTHEYCADGVDPLPCDPEHMLAPWRERLNQNLPVLVPDSRALDADTAPAQLTAARAFLVLPIMADGHLAGALGFAFQSVLTEFGPVEIDRMKVAAEMIETVLARRTVDLAHRDTARRLEATLAALPDLLFELNADGTFAEFAAGPTHLMAAPPETLRGKHMSEMLPPNTFAIAQHALETTMKTGRVDGVRYRLDLPDGPHWFELTGALKPASTPDTDPTIIFLVRDVTADTRIREEVSRLGKIVETMPNLVCIIDIEGRIVWCNTAFEQQIGWSLADIRGKDLAGLVRVPGFDDVSNAAVARAMARHEPYTGQTVNQDRHGQRYWVEFNIVPLQDTEGQPIGFVTVETVVTKSKLQEAELARLAHSATEARERLENAVRALPDGAIILDEQERVIVANSAYRDMFPQLSDLAQPGTSLRQILSRGAELGVFGRGETPAERSAWVEERIATYRQPSYSDETELPDGRWLRRIHTRTSDGGIVAIAMDVTARHNQIAALDAANRELSAALHDRDAAERRLRGIMEGADVGTWEWDIATDTLRVGGHWAQMLGRDPKSLGIFHLSDFRDLVHPDDVPLLPHPAKQYAELGEGFSELEFRMRHDLGHWVWILSRSRVTAWSDDGTPRMMAGVHLDISDRKRLEQQLEAGRAYLSEVMDTSIAALAVLNDRGEITYANLEAERIIGLKRSDLFGRTYNDVFWRLERVDGSPMPDDELPFRRALREGSVRDVRFALHWPDGTRRVLSANAVALSPTSAEQQVAVSFSDITDALAATSRLEEARAKAEDMSRAKSIFLANMSHEIRTPLNGVLGMAEVLDSIVTAPEQKHMVATIRRSGETLLAVLNSILDMSKIEAGKMVLEEMPIILSDVLAQVEALHSVQAEEKGLEFQVLTSAGADLPRIGDQHRLQQILNNLLSNAIKFTESGQVRLKLSCRPGKPVTIDITDDGVGMTEAQLSRVFESFEQADGSMTRRFGGTGLGLSIVRQLVLLMGGMITMTSTPGKGTQVRVILPLPEADPASITRPEPDEVPDLTLLEGRSLLVADDNVTNRLVLSEMLGQTGVKVTLVENGQEAISAWDRARSTGGPFDLLLLDITMPVLDGMSALSEIRRREDAHRLAPVPAVAVTANAMPNQVADYIIGGFDTHLAKPFKRKELLHALRTLLRA